MIIFNTSHVYAPTSVYTVNSEWWCCEFWEYKEACPFQGICNWISIPHLENSGALHSNTP